MTGIGFDPSSGALVITGAGVYPAGTLRATLMPDGSVQIVSLAQRFELYMPWQDITDLSGANFASSGDAMAYLTAQLGMRRSLGLSYPSEAAMVWTIQHSLGFYPNVIVIDTTGDPVVPDLRFPDIDTVTLTFGQPTAGTAYLS